MEATDVAAALRAAADRVEALLVLQRTRVDHHPAHNRCRLLVAPEMERSWKTVERICDAARRRASWEAASYEDPRMGPEV